MKKKIEEVQEEVEKEVMVLEDVTGVFVGEKDNKSVIKVGLKKIDPNITKRIPQEKEGYSIVVEETGEYTAY